MKKSIKSTQHVTASDTVHASIAHPEVAPAAPTPAPVAPSPAPVASPASGVVTAMADPAVQECIALLDQVVAKLGERAPLDGHEIRRATKMRKGGAEVIPKILALCVQHGVTRIGSLTTQEMSDELKRGDALVQVGLRSAVVQKKVKDSAMGAHGRSWQIAMTMYTTLQRLAVDDPELALGLASVESFFQTKTTKGKVRANKRASAAKKAAKGGASAPVAVAEPVTVVAAGTVAAAPVVAPAHVVAPAPVAPEAAGAGEGAATAAPPAAVASGGAH